MQQTIGISVAYPEDACLVEQGAPCLEVEVEELRLAYKGLKLRIWFHFQEHPDMFESVLPEPVTDTAKMYLRYLG